MFEELCRKTSSVRVPDKTYTKSVPKFPSVRTFQISRLSPPLVISFYIRDMRHDIPAMTEFIDESVRVFDLSNAERLYDNFSDTQEFFVPITRRKGDLWRMRKS